MEAARSHTKGRGDHMQQPGWKPEASVCIQLWVVLIRLAVQEIDQDKDLRESGQWPELDERTK